MEEALKHVQLHKSNIYKQNNSKCEYTTIKTNVYNFFFFCIIKLMTRTENSFVCTCGTSYFPHGLVYVFI